MRLTAEDLAADRGGQAIFSGIGFSLGEGEMLVVTGANGAGKSTLLRVIAGLLQPQAGRVSITGGEAWPTVASACHFVGHQNGMKPALTVAQNLAFWRDYLGERRETVGAALDKVGLAGTDDLPLGYLSAGQRRRASLARLLLSWRPVWLLDEPATGLDAASVARLARLMHAHLGEGGLIVAATHQQLGLEASARLEMGRGAGTPPATAAGFAPHGSA